MSTARCDSKQTQKGKKTRKTTKQQPNVLSYGGLCISIIWQIYPTGENFISDLTSTHPQKRDNNRRGGFKAEGEEDPPYNNPLSAGTKTTSELLVNASVHPNGTKYKSHPVPK